MLGKDKLGKWEIEEDWFGPKPWKAWSLSVAWLSNFHWSLEVLVRKQLKKRNFAILGTLASWFVLIRYMKWYDVTWVKLCLLKQLIRKKLVIPEWVGLWFKDDSCHLCLWKCSELFKLLPFQRTYPHWSLAARTSANSCLLQTPPTVPCRLSKRSKARVLLQVQNMAPGKVYLPVTDLLLSSLPCQCHRSLSLLISSFLFFHKN